MGDRYKDEYFENISATVEDKRYLQGQLSVIDDIVGLVAFIKSFKVFEAAK